MVTTETLLAEARAELEAAEQAIAAANIKHQQTMARLDEEARLAHQEHQAAVKEAAQKKFRALGGIDVLEKAVANGIRGPESIESVEAL